MDAVIFDCDGVLVDSEVTGLRVILACLAEIGLTYDRHDYIERFLGSTWSDFYSRLDGDHRARLGAPLPAGFPAVVSARFAADAAADSLAIAGVHDLVGGLSLPKAIASGSTPGDLDKKLRRVGLFEIFAPHIYSAQIVAKGKPSPDIYLHVAAQLGIDPADCVAVGFSILETNGTASPKTWRARLPALSDLPRQSNAPRPIRLPCARRSRMRSASCVMKKDCRQPRGPCCRLNCRHRRRP